MEHNPWKLATIGMALVGMTSLGTGLTTAYLMRPASAQEPPPTTMTHAYAAPRPAVQTVARTTTPRVTPVSTTAGVANECATGSQRAWKIAKPGLLGGLVGAGLGAAGGAIANGGSAAGKGALIGGLAGAALGGGYGAYKTKQECGTIFGNAAGSGFAGGAPTYSGAAPQAALRPATGNGITVYNAR